MPYKNIVFVKLEKRLLNDHRWYTMSDHAQLIYIKLILLAAETYNKIPKNDDVLIQALRSGLEIGMFKGAIEEIKKNFPKFKANKHFYYFGEFEHKTNYRHQRDYLGSSLGSPKVGVDKEKNKIKNKRKNREFLLSDEDFLKGLKTNLIYKYINIDHELGKMDVWLSTHPNRKKTRRFIVNWLNKIERPVNFASKKEPQPDPACYICQGKGRIPEGQQEGAVCLCVK